MGQNDDDNNPSITSIGTILCAERWCCRSSLLGYWVQYWTGCHSDTGYQQAGTHFADLGRMTGSHDNNDNIENDNDNNNDNVHNDYDDNNNNK